MHFIDELAIWLHWQLLIISFLSPILKSLHYNDSDGVLILHRYYRVTDISGFSFCIISHLNYSWLLSGSGNSSIVTMIDFLSVILFICLILNRITLFAYFQWHIGVILWRLLVFYLIHETVDVVHSSENFQPRYQCGQFEWICTQSFSQ